MLDWKVVAALTRSLDSSGATAWWHAELLADLAPAERPEPFCEIAHEFESFAEACDWLGAPRPSGSELLAALRHD